MKLIHLLILVALLIVGWFAWRSLPGVRTQVENKVEEYGGWTAEARESDPVGFLTFAQERFGEDLESFAASRASLAQSREQANAELDRLSKLIEAAGDLADQYRIQFETAEAANEWPVEIGGASYDRDQLIEQVERILEEKRVSERVSATYSEVVEATEKRDDELRERIAFTQATLEQLAAQKELVRVDQMTSKGDELLRQVEVLLGGNQTAISSENGPVRGIEELLSAAEDEPKETNSEQAAREFLELD